MLTRRSFAASLAASAAFQPLAHALAFDRTRNLRPTGHPLVSTKFRIGMRTRNSAFLFIGASTRFRRGPRRRANWGRFDPTKWFTDNAYAEWYLNTLRIQGSPGYEHHIATYGKNFDYYQFAPIFNDSTKKWDPERWAKLFKKTGARYAVLTTKHHDGFRLWPSQVQNPHRASASITARRDLAGELTSAVRNAGMHMGLYYSGGLDWTFTEKPIVTMDDLMARVPQTEEYARYADAHWTELTDRYQPAVMWNDISYPKAGKIPQLFSHYYNSVPEGVINNRFGVDFADFTTPEYAKYDKITAKKWESCRGLGYSFGYNQAEGPEQVIAADQLVWLLVDIVSKNGNLLLNIGPKPDGTISDIQMDRLNRLGDWLAIHGEEYSIRGRG